MNGPCLVKASGERRQPNGNGRRLLWFAQRRVLCYARSHVQGTYSTSRSCSALLAPANSDAKLDHIDCNRVWLTYTRLSRTSLCSSGYVV
jgi:hypothetical protein